VGGRGWGCQPGLHHLSWVVRALVCWQGMGYSPGHFPSLIMGIGWAPPPLSWVLHPHPLTRGGARVEVWATRIRVHGCPGASFWSFSVDFGIRSCSCSCPLAVDVARIEVLGWGLTGRGRLGCRDASVTCHRWSVASPAGRGWGYSPGHFPLLLWALDGGSMPF